MALSPCGTFVAVATGSVLTIHRIIPDILIRKVSLSSLIGEHTRQRDTKGVKVTNIEWEAAPENGECTKLALSIENPSFSGLAVVETLVHNEPVLIEQDCPVDRLQWIPGVEKAEGAYKNSVQLAVTCDGGLQLRLYSLDCSNIVLTVAKPLAPVLIRPRRQGRFWSVISTPYYDKNSIKRSVLTDLASSTAPVISHFYNHLGSSSYRLISTKLDFVPSSDACINWDPTGQWLCIFDPSLALCGYTIKVYNSLGISSSDSTRFSPTLSANHSRGIGWRHCWVSLSGSLFVVAFEEAIRVDAEVKFRIHGVTHLSTVTETMVDVSKSGKKWMVSRDPLTFGPKYSRTASMSFENLHTQTWLQCISESNMMILASEKTIAIFRLSSRGAILKLDPMAVVSVATPVSHIKVVDTKVVLVFKDHVAVYEGDAGISILGTSHHIITEAVVGSYMGVPVVTILENTSTGAKWRRLDSSDSKLSVFEDTERVAGLIEEAQGGEWTRTRLEDNDTFHRKRRRL